MDRPKPQLHQSVHEVLTDWPEAVRAFQALKTTCVGCYLARFCTLTDVATTYHLSADAVMAEMRKATHNFQSLSRSE